MKIKSNNKVIIQSKKFKCNSKVSKCRMEGCKKVRSVFGAGKNAGTKKKYGRCRVGNSSTTTKIETRFTKTHMHWKVQYLLYRTHMGLLLSPSYTHRRDSVANSMWKEEERLLFYILPYKVWKQQRSKFHGKGWKMELQKQKDSSNTYPCAFQFG